MRLYQQTFLLGTLLTIAVSACVPSASNAPAVATVAPPNSTLTITTGETSAHQLITCSDLDAAWAANDWPKVLDILQRLQETDQRCGPESLEAKAYAARFNYAVALEAANLQAEAIEQYRAALAINRRGREALAALARIKALPTLPAPLCHPTAIAAYSVKLGDFITVTDSGFTLKGEPFYLRGFNYYPRHTPWEAFLTSANLAEIAQEFDLIAGAGFNTLRIALWYDPLFTCEPESAIPNADGFAKLDAVIRLARERGLKLIVALNDLPDLYYRPLYTDYARYDAQTAFIVNRYRDEPAILAWDLRNEPDLDYGADGRSTVISAENVIKWLTHIAEIVRQNDQHHLITIGWWGDATTVSEIVDFLSFHHWTSAEQLAQRIKTFQAASRKPIVLEEVGYPAWDQDSDARQAQSLQDVLDLTENNGTAGWLIWTAFDFIPPPGQTSNPEYYFGLWRSDLTPKPALSAPTVNNHP